MTNQSSFKFKFSPLKNKNLVIDHCNRLTDHLYVTYYGRVDKSSFGLRKKKKEGDNLEIIVDIEINEIISIKIID